MSVNHLIGSKVPESQFDWYTRERLKTIEVVAKWTGAVNTTALISVFGITRVAASRDFKRYIESCPGNLYYNATRRTYVKAEPFQLRFSKGHIDEFFEYLSRSTSIETDVRSSVLIERLQPTAFHIPAALMAPVVQAVRQCAAMVIRYASLTHPDGTERTIVPHTLVYASYRWHLRAYCQQRQSFRDFNLSRILGVPTVLGPASPAMRAGADDLWQRMVLLKFAPSPLLSEPQRRVIEREFSMQGGIHTFSTRAALLHYSIQTHQASLKPEPDKHLVVANVTEIEPYLFRQEPV